MCSRVRTTGAPLPPARGLVMKRLMLKVLIPTGVVDPLCLHVYAGHRVNAGMDAGRLRSMRRALKLVLQLSLHLLED